MKASIIRLSALTKRNNRVKVQLLKDFPEFQLYKGQVANVKASLMNNFLHYNNGAKFILKDSDIDQALVTYRTKHVTADTTIPKKVVLQKTKINNQTASLKTEEPKEVPKLKKEKLPQSSINKDVTLDNIKIPGLDI
ncbi:related to 54S ribosomal protein L50, mitochondrial [Saccharomycodes ludwigii]|uniref:Related to 54S ribosomal protein L50, mitochondrial n=1 Tax=Saccharomycodes ludwigii TaxID=36035 RepID=A0A376B5Y6_9ASCO|nr:hypothetical protein SCDLUD_001220 [Saccharomycodes ludwigii]KAH3903578.1 hypothetical protein SCDLUD_001220 [Saccharomycodes ludwigii]SSD60042.1 related to 54S ribosomal protein L50, mitochondrial [Saccharomycodes ludwigii]